MMGDNPTTRIDLTANAGKDGRKENPMTQAQKDKTMDRAVNIAAIIVTALVTGAVAWGATAQRVSYVEREISDIRPILMRIDRTLSAMEQCARETERRLERLEQ